MVNFRITDSTRVCSAHFKQSELKRTLTGKRELEKKVVPSIFNWITPPRKRKSPKKRKFQHVRLDKSSPASVIGKSLEIYIVSPS